MKKFILLTALLLTAGCSLLAPEQKTADPAPWAVVASDVTATVYNAVPEQCNQDVAHTASMFRLNLDDVLSHRIIAMERTMMRELGVRYGDKVLIEGAGPWDGVWQVQDTMNRRFAGQHRIDFLVPNHIRTGKWTNVRVSVRTGAS